MHLRAVQFFRITKVILKKIIFGKIYEIGSLDSHILEPQNVSSELDL